MKELQRRPSGVPESTHRETVQVHKVATPNTEKKDVENKVIWAHSVCIRQQSATSVERLGTCGEFVKASQREQRSQSQLNNSGHRMCER